MNQGSRVVAVVAVVVLLGGGAYLWWQRQQAPAPPPPPAVAQAPAPPAPPPPPAKPDAGIQNPIETVPPLKGQLPGLDDADDFVSKALTELFGKRAMAAFILATGFPRHFVATVDNLPREHASALLWPVNTTPGIFETEARGEGTVISPLNARRYVAFVHFVQSVNTRRAVILYRQLYPLFQQAYVELGYPEKYFNDRLVEVIDHLLETPDLGGAIKVARVQVEGADPKRPGLYKYEDPAVEMRSAGHKILLRVGPDNAAKLKAKLLEIRRQIARTRPAGG